MARRGWCPVTAPAEAVNAIARKLTYLGAVNANRAEAHQLSASSVWDALGDGERKAARLAAYLIVSALTEAGYRIVAGAEPARGAALADCEGCGRAVYESQPHGPYQGDVWHVDCLPEGAEIE